MREGIDNWTSPAGALAGPPAGAMAWLALALLASPLAACGASGPDDAADVLEDAPSAELTDGGEPTPGDPQEGDTGGDTPSSGDDASTTDARSDEGAGEPDFGEETWTPPPHPYAGTPLLSDDFLNIAHRGGGLLAPEQTLEAYENAVAVGADVIECDVHSTADGVLICMHDHTVERTTNGSGLVHDFSFEALRELDAGYNFTTDGGATWPYRGAGVQVATLEEFFTQFEGVSYSIEIKQAAPPISADVVALVERLEVADRTVIASFSDQIIAEVRALNPDLITAFALAEMLDWVQVRASNEADYRPPAQILQIPPTQGDLDLLEPEMLARASRLGLRVQVWTINSREEMERLLDLGVDGIFTDDPATLAEVIAERE